MWGRMSTTSVGPARSVDRAEDTVGVVLCVLFEIVLAIYLEQLSYFGLLCHSHNMYCCTYCHVQLVLYVYSTVCVLHFTKCCEASK